MNLGLLETYCLFVNCVQFQVTGDCVLISACSVFFISHGEGSSIFSFDSTGKIRCVLSPSREPLVCRANEIRVGISDG